MTPARAEVLMGWWGRQPRGCGSVVYAAIFTLVFSLVTLAMVGPGPPMPKLTVNWPGLPRAVERTATT